VQQDPLTQRTSRVDLTGCTVALEVQGSNKSIEAATGAGLTVDLRTSIVLRALTGLETTAGHTQPGHRSDEPIGRAVIVRLSPASSDRSCGMTNAEFKLGGMAGSPVNEAAIHQLACTESDSAPRLHGKTP